MADVVGPRRHMLCGTHVRSAGEGPGLGITQRRPLPVESICKVGLVVPASVLFDDCQELIPAFQAVRVTRLEDLSL